MSMPIIQAVSRNPKHGFSKTPQTSLRLIEGEGIEGDAHRGRTVQHLYLKRKDATQPNLCQVHLLEAERLTELTGQGFDLQPGELGENILTQDIDLLKLPRGTRLHLGSEAVVEITGLRTPCSQIDDHRDGLQELMWGPRDASNRKTRRAGVMSVVIQGGVVSPQDTIRIELPSEPHLPQGPV
jgi:MOSC domain-containing protein YiiM